MGIQLKLDDLKKRAVIVNNEITDKLMNHAIQEIYAKVLSGEEDITLIFQDNLGGSSIAGSKMISTMEMLKSMEVTFTGLAITECSSAAADIFFFCNKRLAVNAGTRFLMHPGRANTPLSTVLPADCSKMTGQDIESEFLKMMEKQKPDFVKYVQRLMLYDQMLHRNEIGSKIFDLMKEDRFFYASELAEKGFLEILVK